MVPKVPIATENWLFWPQIQPQNVAVARAYISDLFQKKYRRMIAQFEGGRTGKKRNIILPIYLCNNKHLGCVSDRLCLGNIMLSNKDCMKKRVLDTFLCQKKFLIPNCYFGNLISFWECLNYLESEGEIQWWKFLVQSKMKFNFQNIDLKLRTLGYQLP